MKVSILIPVYGVERYIAQCAESLFAQTYKDIEYIFVDDCSPDRSIAVLQEVLERFPERKSQVRVIRHEKNSGVGQTRDTAFKNSTGKFLTHADPDDLMSLDAIEQMVIRQEETDADIVDGGYQMFDDNGMCKDVMPYHGSDEKHLKVALCPALLPGRLWGRLYRRSLMADNNISTEYGIDNAEDFSVTARLFFHAKRAVLDKVTYRYRLNTGGSYSNHASTKNIISILKSSQVVYAHLKEHDKQHIFNTALQLSALGSVRSVRKYGATNSLIDEYLHYKPEGIIFRFLNWSLRGGLPYKMADVLYRVVRGMYITLA